MSFPSAQFVAVLASLAMSTPVDLATRSSRVPGGGVLASDITELARMTMGGSTALL